MNTYITARGLRARLLGGLACLSMLPAAAAQTDAPREQPADIVDTIAVPPLEQADAADGPALTLEEIVVYAPKT